MYIDTSKIIRGSKTYIRKLLRTSFRENGKVKHKTIANLSECSDEEIAALKLALKNKKDLSKLISLKDIQTTLGKRFGAAWALSVIADRIGVKKALGNSPDAKLALLQITARVIEQGSRLSAVRLAKRHSICEILGINSLTEDDLYSNLSWLADQQENIEKKLFRLRFPDAVPTLFLYDVTSTYFEGNQNELADWGYNRDKKRGKKQIVIGLLTGPDGSPVAVRVFKGNTVDSKTVSEQVKTLAENFGVKNITIVGDRGMLKTPQINELPDDFLYITAITKPQILKMLHTSTFQYELFTERVCEVEADGIRYVLRRNPYRAEQISATRDNKYAYIKKLCEAKNSYLKEHPKASVKVAAETIEKKIIKIKANKWILVKRSNRSLMIEKNQAALESEALLDGCYVIKSNVKAENATTTELHDRYCDLESVERAFRTIKTTHLELRPVFVRKAENTMGHVFVVMLALLLQREIEKSWRHLDITVEEGISELSAISSQTISIGDSQIQNFPIPTDLGKSLLSAINVSIPEVFPYRKPFVDTKKKLQSER